MPFRCQQCKEVQAGEVVLGVAVNLLTFGLAYAFSGGFGSDLCDRCETAQKRRMLREQEIRARAEQEATDSGCQTTSSLDRCRRQDAAREQDAVREQEAFRKAIFDKRVHGDNDMTHADTCDALFALSLSMKKAAAAMENVRSQAMDLVPKVEFEILTFLENPTYRAPRFDRIYSPTPKLYGTRGGHPYFKPEGWKHFGIRVHDMECIKGWPVAYHGTRNEAVLQILEQGLRSPSERGVPPTHGRVGTEPGEHVVYVSKSVCVAAHPVYSQLLKLEPGRFVQLVFKCRVKPGTFRSQRNTLGQKHWNRELKMDPNYEDNSDMEWLVTSCENLRITGLLYREFGPGVDASIYGHLPTQVVEPFGLGPEFKWTEILQDNRRCSGDFVKPA